LHDIGYATGGFGKWGLGGPETSGAPTHQGLDRFFGYNCQGVAHNFYPTHLWDNDRQVPLDNPAFAAHQRWPAGLDPLAQASYAAYLGRRYAPDVIAEQALQFLDAHASRPFLLFFPSTIPHLALQIPPDELRRFAGRFEETPYTGQRGYLPQRWPRACYAAMVTHLDRHVGQLLEALDRRGLTENTIVIFSSDNGPAVSGTGGVDTDFFGSGGNLRGRKGSLYEGGLRVPLVVRWPGVIPADTRSPAVSGFEDWLPTLLELIGHAERTPSGLDGRSLASTLRGGPPLERELLYREIPADRGQQALWVGRWKLVRRHLRPATAGDGPTTELFDLEADPTETNDLAAQHPEVATRLAAILDQQHEPSALFPLTAAEGRPRP
jgi:arylsulfatase A-like enzyme